MSFDKSGLADYEEVPDRIRRFIEKYPDGSLRCEHVEYRDLPAAHKGGEPCMHVIYHAAAYRTPEDPSPGHGMASEPLPGLTPYTKGSELMNAETSAWGRALVALGFVAKKIASAEEVRNRSGEDTPKPKASNSRGPNEKQLGYLTSLMKQKVPHTDQQNAFVGGTVAGLEVEEGWTGKLSSAQVSEMIDRLKEGDFPPTPEPAPAPPSDVPEDGAEGFTHPAQPSLDDVIADGTLESEAA